jgi:hypothetical protein
MSMRQTRAPALPRGLVKLVDLQLGLVTTVVDTSFALGDRLAAFTQPVRRSLTTPAASAFPPRAKNGLHALAARGRHSREDIARATGRLLDVLVPFVVTELVARVDLTGIVADHVDVDHILTRVDLDAAASRLDLNALVEGLDIDRVVMSVDLMDVVQRRLDLNAVVAGVDMDAAAATLDLEAVIRRVDLAALARDVIAQLDLPEIIRESTGSMASDTVRGVRMQSISGDEALGRIIDRLRVRRSRRGNADVTVAAEPLAEDLVDPKKPKQPGTTGTTS